MTVRWRIEELVLLRVDVTDGGVLTRGFEDDWFGEEEEEEDAATAVAAAVDADADAVGGGGRIDVMV